MNAVPPIPPRRYTVAVRELCDFAAKQGDLDLRFTPSPSAQQGMAGHKLVASRRGPAYRAEVSLSGDHQELTVRGRADGYDAQAQRLEEVKTYKGEFARVPDNHRALHWAQAKVYGWLLCRQLGLEQLDVSIVYLEIGTQQETALSQACSAAELQSFFEALCGSFLAWARQELEHRQQRDDALVVLPFPHAEFRTGQRALAENVFRAAQLGRCLMAQAPTGIGKTIGTVFPLLKACPSQELDKVFFLSAKGSGRALALQAIDRLRADAPAWPLRVVELVAREKACEHPDKACHGESCPLARGFYDRLPAARAAAAAAPRLDQASLRELARLHAVCPYYLGQEMVRWSDVVVGDYNHWFDSTALLHGLTVANGWRVVVLVDEAHNLVDRARAMYSMALAQPDLQVLRRFSPTTLKLPLEKLQRAWSAVAKGQDEAYRVLETLPRKFITALQEASTAIAELLAVQPAGIEAPLLRFYFDALQFGRLAESFGDHSLFDVSLERPGAGLGTGASERANGSAGRDVNSGANTGANVGTGTGAGKHPSQRAGKGAVLCIRNVVPAPFLAPRFAAARSTVLFSATLTPQHFYVDTLGLPQDTARLEVDAPFSAEQLAVRIVGDVSTRFHRRAASLAPIARLMAAQVAAVPGNYLAFFSSFDYLQQAADAFGAASPGVPTWQQTRGMAEADRAAFLARFRADGQGIGFAVLGGSFAEGVDLPGARLIGAFIATLGLPQFNPVNEEMKRRVDTLFGAGHDYTYLFPGIRKVVQAAGRVIRTPTDRGSVFLIDDRFSRPEVLRLLPSWWQVERTRALAAPGVVRPR